MHEKQIDFPRTAGWTIGGWWSLVTLMVCVDRNVGSTMLKPYVHGPRLPAAYVNVNAISAPIVVANWSPALTVCVPIACENDANWCAQSADELLVCGCADGVVVVDCLVWFDLFVRCACRLGSNGDRCQTTAGLRMVLLTLYTPVHITHASVPKTS